MRFSVAVKAFLAWMRADGKSENTVNIYRHKLGLMAKLLEDPEVAHVDGADVLRYAKWLRDGYRPVRASKDTSPLSTSSILNAWCSVRAFFTWAEENKLVANRPDGIWRQPKRTSAEVLPFNEDEIRALLAATSHSRYARSSRRKPFRMQRFTYRRDYAILLVLLDTGLRAGELCRLRVQDVNQETGEVFVAPFGSGRKTKSRHVWLSAPTLKALLLYLGDRMDLPTDWLFLTRDKQPMTANTVRLLFAALGRKAKVQKSHPHRMRHTFAIQWLRNGGDVFTLQRMLGHSTLTMVNRYLSIAVEDVANAHHTASPVDRWRL